MSAALRLTDHTASPLTHVRGGLTTPTRMDIHTLQRHFWKLDAEQHFSGNETRLYFYWLNLFNAEFWPEQLVRFCKQVEADTGMDDRAHGKARKALIERGLLYYQEGAKGRAALWSLLRKPARNIKMPRNNAEEYEPIPTQMPAQIGEELAVIPTQMPRNNAVPYIEQTKTVLEQENTNKKNAAAGVDFSEEFSSLTERKKLVTAPNPVAAPPSPAGDDADEARAFVPALAALWHVSEAKNMQAWRRLTRFALLIAEQGRLQELREQFAGFRAFFGNAGLTPHNADKFTGHETADPPYCDGTWCECDWPAKAADRKPKTAPGAGAEKPARASAAPSTQNTWR